MATMVMLRCYCVMLYLQCLFCCTVYILTNYNMSFHCYAVASRDTATTVFTQIFDHSFSLIHHLKNELLQSHSKFNIFCVGVFPKMKFGMGCHYVHVHTIYFATL